MDKLYCNPDIYVELVKKFESEGKMVFSSNIPSNFDMFDRYFPYAGIQIIVDKNIPKYAKKWVPPSDGNWAFCEFDGSETWAKNLGYGHYEDDITQPVVYAIKDQKYLNSIKDYKYDENLSYMRDNFISNILDRMRSKLLFHF